MSKVHGHKHSGSVTQNQKAQLANAYNELGKELSSSKIRVVGNYTLGRVIGEGAYGKVRIGTHRLTSTRVAIKQIPKAMSASLTREIHHHRQLHHPHVTQMYEVIATESSIWIVTELCSGGELFDYLAEKGRLTEDESRFIFGQLCLAVAYLHGKGIVHRDLKLENVLLDEHCRVKLGDFGFTREFERGALMDTYCGTTGYASPEMLQGQRYQGPEVDVWSLGVILYCLLTGMLPFDDDDESVMRDKVILGDFEDPEWLSIDARDLIKNILQKEPSRRLTIPQILSHPWFTSNQPVNESDTVIVKPPQKHSASPTPDTLTSDTADSALSSEASTTESAFHSAIDSNSSALTTPEHSTRDFFDTSADSPEKSPSTIHPNPSETTIRKIPDVESRPIQRPETVAEEGLDEDASLEVPLNLQRQRTNSSGRSTAPPVHTVRTPARTKRRSVSSTLSDPDENTLSTSGEKAPILPSPQKDNDINFASLLSTPAPIIFSTPLERELLNMMSVLGFDLGQIVYSVLNDACDAAGAVWWMLKRRAEKKLLEVGTTTSSPAVPDSALSPTVDSQLGKQKKYNVGVQTDPAPQPLNLGKAPQLTFVPPTPTFPPRPTTPPRTTSPSPSRTSMLTPSSSVIVDSSAKSHPSTPGSGTGSKGRKNRSGSVSIMQRATTALEAAGLVRKRSSEAVKEDKERDKEKEANRYREIERKNTGSSMEEGPRSSHGSGSSKLTKSPPLRASKGPSTPPPSELHQPQPHLNSSPWVLTESRESIGHLGHHAQNSGSRLPPTPANSPGTNDLFALASPNLGEGSGTNSTGKASSGSHRNRASLLTAFRLWFHEDRRGKRKENAPNSPPSGGPRMHGRQVGSGQGYSSTSVKRTSDPRNGVGSRFGRGGRRTQRPSISSRRSSSVNSRRSSVASVQMVVLDSPQVPTRRSIGSRTPNSDRDYSSRPSSIRSFSMQRHRKSPSASSTGSVRYRATSPMQSKYHRRGGSGSSSTTRVVRQPNSSSSSRPVHGRSNSATSSIHSPPSSRPTSFIECSDQEGPRTASPFKTRRYMDDRGTPRRGGREGTSTFVAQKRQGPFASPMHHGNSIGRSSWKKSWGLEPPGWQNRTAHLPVEVLAISPAEGTSIRDVFSGRQSLSLGDESDWVDEDDDIPFAGGLGQMTSLGKSTPAHTEPSVTLGPAPRGFRAGNKRTGKGIQGGNVGGGSTRQKAGHSPSERASPVQGDSYEPPEARGGRRQLPAGRSGHAFKLPITEEDEEEEEE